jgi:hypothetical protein
MQEDGGGLGFLPWTFPKKVRAPEPPGGFRRRRKPKAQRERERRREHQREIRAERLHLAALSRVGAVITGSAVIVAAALIVALIVAAH